ncbi:hypothetical protein RP20_CCG000601 [Aedes albopictus]|nr:hypothetical protein RP20_CCG000601 [Aedes albopictus]
MEIQTITLEHWMCRVCLGKGAHNIFDEQLSLAPEDEHHQGQPSSTRHHSSSDPISIIDALNCFCEYKICKPDTVNEPIMLCESCHAELVSCVKFRRKLNESEALLRKDCSSPDAEEEIEDRKTGLTMQMVDIEPFLDDESDEPLSPEVIKTTKTHYSKPRFQLTHQVSNILRHVATTSSSSNNSANDNPGREKRKESDCQSDSETPKKIQRRNSQQALLDRTLVIPHYIFSGQIKFEEQELSLESRETSEPSLPRYESNPDRLDTDEIFHCTHCPKAFATPQHLASHTKNVHQCQHCRKYFPTTLAKNVHNREEHRSFQCTHCSYRSRYIANLKSHQRRVHSSAALSVVEPQNEINA